MAYSELNRYAAKLLFQFRVMIGQDPGKRRICEERIIVLHAPSAEKGLELAQQHGEGAEFGYINDKDNNVYFEFVGVLELIELGLETEENEVWYDIKEYLTPMERKADLIPDTKELSVFKTKNRK